MAAGLPGAARGIRLRALPRRFRPVSAARYELRPARTAWAAELVAAALRSSEKTPPG